MPKRGSFQDFLLQEVEYRERNLKYSEVSLFVMLFEQLLMLVTDQLNAEPKRVLELKQLINKDVTKMLGTYRAELYQESYSPEYRKHMDSLLRREKKEAELARARDEAALALVSKLGAED